MSEGKKTSDLSSLKSTHRHDLQGVSFLLLFTEDANAGKEEVEEAKVGGGEVGEDGEEEGEEEETGRDVDPRRSLQFSESLPLNTFPV